MEQLTKRHQFCDENLKNKFSKEREHFDESIRMRDESIIQLN